MAKVGTLALKGVSGKEYRLDVYDKDTEWSDNFSCVYYISQRIVKPDGSGTHNKIYIGETEDLKRRLANHPKQKCFNQHNYNVISVRQENMAQIKLAIEEDLLEALHPPCND